MGRSRINTLNSGVTPSVLYTPYFLHFLFFTLCIFYTPHIAHSSFSTLRKFYTQHSTYFTEPSFRYKFPHLSFCPALKSTTENKEKLSFRTCWKSYTYTILLKDFYSAPKSRSSACTADGRGEMISCVLDYFHAPPTQVF